MAELLYIKASPRLERSYSSRTAEAFLQAYKKKNPGHVVKELDLFETRLPDFDFEAITARYLAARSEEMTHAQQCAWEEVKKTVAFFAAADKYLFSVPMWNYSLPWRLKLYIDLLVQPGLTFKVVEGRYQGLLANRKAVLICSSGNDYLPGSIVEKWNFQRPYLEFILKYMGIDIAATLEVAPTLSKGPESAKKALEQAKAEAALIAENF